MTVFAPMAYCLQSIDKQVFEKTGKCAITKVKLDWFPGRFQASWNHNQGLYLIFFLATIRLSHFQLDMKNLWFIRSALQLQENLHQQKKVPIWTSGCCYLCPNFPYRWSNKFQCKMELTGLHNSYGSWHLYICCFLFGPLTFYVASLLFVKGTSCCATNRN